MARRSMAVSMVWNILAIALCGVLHVHPIPSPAVGNMDVCSAICAGNATCSTAVRSSQCAHLCERSHHCRIHCCKNDTGPAVYYDVPSPISAPVLHCRGSEQLSVRWSLGAGSKMDILYVVELLNGPGNDAGDLEEDQIVAAVASSKTIATFYNLTEKHAYRVRLTTFNSTGQLGFPLLSRWFSTLAADFTPQQVPIISMEPLKWPEDGTFSAVFHWKPAEDLTCFYDVVAWDRSDSNYFHQIEANQPDTLFTGVLPGLTYDTNYSIKIQGLNPGHPLGRKESINSWYDFVTPTCFEVHKSLRTCVPPRPENLQVEEVLLEPLDTRSVLYDVVVRWDKPELEPEYYLVMLSNESLTTSQNVSGNSTMVRFEDADLGISYQVSLVAVAPAGQSSKAVVYRQISPEILHTTPRSWKSLSYYAAIGWAIGGATLLAALVAFALKIRRKIIVYRNRRKYFQDLEKKAPKDLGSIPSINIIVQDDPLEIVPDGLLLMEVLGEGAFGVVRRALFQYTGTEAAVKMLKDSPSAEEVKQFKAEIDMMKSVGAHPHLVSLIGCCTRPSQTMMLIVEYCERGDLQNYLRSAWDRMTSTTNLKATIDNPDEQSALQSQFIQYADMKSDSAPSKGEHPNLIINKLYDIDNNFREVETEITATDLLSFGRQIAMGMEFLSTNRIVHRDLAARNVLVCADKTVKIADFGLSRDIYQENMYKKTGSGKLPIKWMALEALTHQVYTTQSDVWSFGVLIWEIVTLGGNPYPSIPTGRLLKLLLSGYRMERPLNCSQGVYQVMLSCWSMRPRDRPTFTELRQQLDLMLATTSENTYLDLDILDTKDVYDFRQLSSEAQSRLSPTDDFARVDSERYIKPTPVKRPTSSMNLNLYSHLPMHPPPYPAPTAAGLQASHRLSQSCNVNMPENSVKLGT